MYRFATNGKISWEDEGIGTHDALFLSSGATSEWDDLYTEFTAYTAPGEIHNGSLGLLSILLELKSLVDAGKPIYSFSAGRDNEFVTDAFLLGPGNVPTNVAGFVVPVNCNLIAISAAANDAVDPGWTADIQVNGTGSIATLDINTPARTAYASLGVPVLLSAGDELMIYCDGTNVPYPMVTIFVQEV